MLARNLLGASHSSLIELTQQLGMLIKISRNIDRNSEDEKYSTSGEILYVFDTNVVQMFLEPFKNPHFAETFFSKMWRKPHIRSVERADEEINTQSCLIAGEYLMSGQLPGQAQGGGRWYMTASHVDELQRQVDYLVEQSKANAARIAKDEKYAEFALERILELESVLSLDPTKDRDEFVDMVKTQGLKRRLIEQVKMLDAETFKDRAESIRSHEICRLVATDAIFEPAKQLMRLRTPRILGRRQDLESRLSPTPADWTEIRSDSVAWRETIANILQRQSGKTKTTAALTADCDALALVSWANKRWAQPHQRVVFVTGDRTLLEACRQRYVDDPGQRFFVRSIAQYAPLFNPTSARSQIERAKAFDRLREVLEGAMVALNLGLIASGNREQRTHARDWFALLVDRAPESVEDLLRSFFPETVASSWLEQQQSALRKLVEELRSVELLMLEAYPHLVAQRLDIDRQQAFKDAARDGGGSLAGVIGDLLASAKSEGARFSAYMMPSVVEDLLELIEAPEDASQRVSIQIRLPLLETNQFIDFRETVSWLKGQTPQELAQTLERLSHSPETIFAVAALLAFSLEIWKEAARYADLAARASEEAPTTARRPRTGGVDRYELLFLRAISLRFRVLSEHQKSDAAGHDNWRGWQGAALAVLDQCYEHHLQLRERARALRAVSERAALHLASCEIALFQSEYGALQSNEAIAKVFETFESAVRDLEACETLAVFSLNRQIFWSAGRMSKASEAVLHAAERQYLHNVFAARAVAIALDRAAPERRPQLDDALARLPTRTPAPWPNRPLVASAYQLAAEGRWTELSTLTEDDVSLALDRAVIKALKALGPATSPPDATA